MTEAEEEKAEYWSERIFRKFCRRFYWITDADWLPFLAGMNDQQAYGGYKDLKSRGYCLMLRDWAIKETKRTNRSAKKKDISVKKAS